MARTLIPTQSIGANGAGIDDLLWTAWDGVNTMYFNNDGRTLLLAQNRDNAGSRTATIKSVADPYGRVGDKTVVCPIAAGAPLEDGISIYGPFPAVLFNQLGSSQVNVDGGVQTNFFLAAVALPL